ncbi:MAG TPA: hypothetical protein VIB79_27455 [Candidatus Binatia bacterium]
MNTRNFGYGFVLTCRTLLIALLLCWSPADTRFTPKLETNRINKVNAPETSRPNPYHTLTMECPYPDGATVSLVLAAHHRGIKQKPVNSLKNCLEPRVTRWTAFI